MDTFLTRLAATESEQRLTTLKHIYDEVVRAGELPLQTGEVNNHVHTVYSFSPYNPCQAAYLAWQTGLKAVGIMDHDSFAGADEMVKAGKILGIGTTCGVELRVSAQGTPMEDRSLNNPGSSGTFYMAVHGIPAHQTERVMDFTAIIRSARNERNRNQVKALNKIITQYGIEPIDFQTEVYDRSMASKGGTITERHILAALVQRLIDKAGVGAAMLTLLSGKLQLNISDKIAAFLMDMDNPHYTYDLLGLLKSQFLPRFYIQPAGEECPPASQVVEFARNIGAIPAYAYLGDVLDSPTGDKKIEKFEDGFLDELMITLKDLGFQAITFMPPRNSLKQLHRVMQLCRIHGFMQISGVDINSSRQSFSCPEVLLPEFAHLNRSTWALIAHERLSNEIPGMGIFGELHLGATNPENLDARIEHYAGLGEKLDLHTLNLHNVVSTVQPGTNGLSKGGNP